MITYLSDRGGQALDDRRPEATLLLCLLIIFFFGTGAGGGFFSATFSRAFLVRSCCTSFDVTCKIYHSIFEGDEQTYLFRQKETHYLIIGEV